MTEMLYIEDTGEFLRDDKADGGKKELEIVQGFASSLLGEVSFYYRHKYSRGARFRLRALVYQVDLELPAEEARQVMESAQRFVPDRLLTHEKMERLVSLAFQLRGMYLRPVTRKHSPDAP